ncbi:RNA-guided endonuclease InsQ/TnpB family protein [Mycolicibacterium lutetiense]|uniref:Transposase n=1 Tax=Mycolicibacterium lutetiense TaxID=1641992 RepID=A0ABS5A0H0_9MYCO|nr:RNA-guided endonuclease TnpB family protein [Mycolicibacterium lutetiense]MBP2454928.1 putative transposase [Mycolicibacterium lutetiense]
MSELMVVKRCVKYPLAPSAAQSEVLARQAGAARALWNLIHAHHTFYEASRRWPSWSDSDAAIRQARKDIDWLAILPAQAAQQVLKAYQQAWWNYWNGTHGRPTWKTRRARRAVDVPQARDLNLTRLNRKWATVVIPKVGMVKVRLHRSMPERVTGARVVREAFGWMLVVRGENQVVKPRQRRAQRGSVGIDRGVIHTLALSDGSFIDQAATLAAGEKKRLYRLERRAARQRAGTLRGRTASRRLLRTYAQMAGLKARQARRRYDFAHQSTAALVATGMATLVLEDLRVKDMTRSAKGTVEAPGVNVKQKSGLNRSILDQGWTQILTLLAYKAVQAGARVIRVRPHGTSQTCHRCGSTAEGQRESQALFRCADPACGWTGNADTNAAIVIKHRGQEVALLDVEPNAIRQAVKRQNPKTAA